MHKTSGKPEGKNIIGASNNKSSFANSGRMLLIAGLLATVSTPIPTLYAQVNGAGQKPYLGWSTFSQQTIDSSFLTQATIETQSDALHASGLQEHGFNYINIDSG